MGCFAALLRQPGIEQASLTQLSGAIYNPSAFNFAICAG